MRSLPPLNALRAFEAAARHLSFTLAANELHVTQAAVSHQVKALEAWLGVKLFRRLPRSLLLTDQGQALLPEIRAALDRMAQAVARVGSQGGGTLTVSLLTTFALTWLVPRLHRFTAANPGIEVKMLTTPRLVDLHREDVDVAIRYAARPNRTGLRVHKLFDEMLTPLCNRSFRDRLKRPEDLAGVPLLDTTGHNEEADWSVWLDAAGLVLRGKTPRITFDSTKIAVDAAIEGAGVAIGQPSLFVHALSSGRLFQPFPLIVPSGKAYWLVSTEEGAETAKVRAFRDWVLAELEAEKAELAASA